jgi:hypothetical protein
MLDAAGSRDSEEDLGLEGESGNVNPGWE